MNSMSLETALPLDVRLMNVTAFVLTGIAALMLLMALLGWVANHPVFAISRIVVQGDTQHHDPFTWQGHMAGQLKGSFFTLDTTQARQSFESAPWVRRAVVRREFPGGLRAEIEEHRAVAFWGNGHEMRMVNSYGEVFEANAGEAETEELPRLVGPDAQAGPMHDMYRSLSALLGPYGAHIQTLELSGRGSWRAQLDSQAVFELGRGAPLEVTQRMQRFLLSHEAVMATYQRFGLEHVESVDLRHSEAYAIRLRGVTTVAHMTSLPPVTAIR